MSREGALWIGGLEPYMDEEFIRNSLALMGEDKIISIKVIKNKFTGVPASYGFINFEDDSCALMAMHKLNGKIIPNSTPPVRFKLNHNSTRLMPGEKDSSIWVGDLTPDVDDLTLFKFFSSRFQSIKSAKVVLDQSGFSKGYGFIRFGNEQEQQSALISMMGVSGLGAKPIKVSLAIPKAKQAALASQQQQPATSQLAASIAASINAVAPNGTAPTSSANDYASQQYWQNYNQYWSHYAAWSQYSQQYYDQSAYYGAS
uniref:tRNA selenocysteine-associated protein 1 n=1 Tax=Lepeophtheirus salmonis TaxID=72036 RepID=C1BU34_LEPSM|nr:tRNA selenocysteine-associated protein 1 [Lepeophtheirus salmonis]ADD24564.1 tRNA selenocysteine 1-associated protein 1 [Lepeophtheirus salmonis]